MRSKLFPTVSLNRAFQALTIAAMAVLFLAPNCAAEDSPLTHSFIGVGKASKVVMIGDDGKLEWKLDKPASDVWVLPNGNLLLALYPTKGYPKGGVIEMEPESKKVVFEYKGRQKEISTVVVMENGNYLIAELGATPRAVEVAKDGTVVSEMPFQCQKGNVHMQVRMLRVLPNGNYIAPHLLDFAVNEYDPKSGKVLKSFATDERGQDKRDWPFTAIRLDNGNTVIGCTNGNRVIELDESGKIVWEISNDDLPEPIISDACGVQRLPNGNTVIASYRAKGNKPKLIEVTREKKVVWTYSGMKSGFHHFQILTTNGKPLAGNTLK